MFHLMSILPSVQVVGELFSIPTCQADSFETTVFHAQKGIIKSSIQQSKTKNYDTSNK